jgi:hypothetical protein
MICIDLELRGRRVMLLGEGVRELPVCPALPLLISGRVLAGRWVTQAVAGGPSSAAVRSGQFWGMCIQLFQAQGDIARAPHLLIPGAFVVAAVTGFVLVGEGLRRASDGRD